MKKFELTKNPLNFLYALLWLGIFCFLAYYTASGKMFLPDENGKIFLPAILVGWVVEYIGIVLTTILIVLIGVFVAGRCIFEKNKSNPSVQQKTV